MKKVLFFLLFLPYVINGYSQIDNNYKIKKYANDVRNQ